jgi:ribulose-bisphosphate carboxylase large chain
MLGNERHDIFRCQVTIAYPFHNFGARIPNLLTIAAGEGVFHAPDIITIRWTDIRFPRSFLTAFQGPQFGVSGLRELLHIHDRPLIFGVIRSEPSGCTISPTGSFFWMFADLIHCFGRDTMYDEPPVI